jgi:site-specific DNA-methyltransferase (adenine-specific)
MTESVEHLAEGVTLHLGDNLAMLPSIAECSIDACVTDPPYELTQANRRNPPPYVEGSPYSRHRLGVNGDAKPVGGFMGKEWDGTGIAHSVDLWRAVYRVLKPGAYLLAFGGTRTFGRMQVAIEDAGFEIRDTIMWLYGSGFPKSHNVSKAIDSSAGAEREVIGRRTDGPSSWMLDQKIEHRANGGTGMGYADGSGKEYDVTAPATDAARQWEGWGTALKPACEPIVLARKPLIGSVAANVLKHGTGALNIDGCRVALDGDYKCRANGRPSQTGLGDNYDPEKANKPDTVGRWPANVVHDGSDEVIAAFPTTTSKGHFPGVQNGHNATSFSVAKGQIAPERMMQNESDSAARFFYTAKADADDRLGSKHPTVKPVDLMAYLVRLVTPKGGTVIDPFAGTGTTGEAALREGMSAVLIEREPEYQEDIRRRMSLAMSGPAERAREAIKARTKDKPADHGPLFAEVSHDD